MSANSKSFKQTLTGGVIYDTISLPAVTTRFFVKSKNLDQVLKIKLGGSSQEILIPVGSYYDSELVNWVNPQVKINGIGEIDGEYCY